MKNYLNIYYQDKVLLTLINISQKYTGVIYYSDNFIKNFSSMPIDALFKILSILSECAFIDIDYFEPEKYKFSQIHILSAGYNHMPRKHSDNIRFYLPLIISIISLLTSIATLTISVITLLR